MLRLRWRITLRAWFKNNIWLHQGVSNFLWGTAVEIRFWFWNFGLKSIIFQLKLKLG